MLIECLTALCLAGATFTGQGYVPLPQQEIRYIEQVSNTAVDIIAANVEPVQEATSAPVPAANNTPVSDPWARLANCESGMNGQPRWDYNGSSGFDGGIQFHPRTWTAFKPDGYPAEAWQATPAQQIEVGRLVAAAQGAGAWPSCTAKLGITTEELLR